MKIAIYGYGNLGHGVEAAAKQNDDVELIGIFTRRSADSMVSAAKTPVYNISEIDKFEKEIDVLIICGGSATDLPKMTPEFAKKFNVVDSFDTHANIPTHYKNVNEAAVSGGNIAIISTGWDPGMFSIARLYSSAILPQGKDYTFWGKGVSQGHSDAIRRIDGVLDARQYTVPVEAALEAVRSGENPELTTRQKHTRECYVVAEDGADLAGIEKEIKEMPNYFADYDTTVNFISKEEMLRNHSTLPHGGSVIRTGFSGLENQNKHVIEYSLKLDSNPEFTANVLIAFARAINKMHKRGEVGCKTVFDIAPADLSPLSADELRAKML